MPVMALQGLAIRENLASCYQGVINNFVGRLPFNKRSRDAYCNMSLFPNMQLYYSVNLWEYMHFFSKWLVPSIVAATTVVENQLCSAWHFTFFQNLTLTNLPFFQSSSFSHENCWKTTPTDTSTSMPRSLPHVYFPWGTCVMWKHKQMHQLM